MLKKLFNFIKNLFIEEPDKYYFMYKQKKDISKENYINKYYYLYMNCPRK